MDSGATAWTVSPGGEDGLCIYLAGSPVSETCGPDGRFRSSRTEGSEIATNSSLSVVSITENLNGTLVACSDGGVSNDLIGSYSICITGKCLWKYYTFKPINIIS